jgi:hypothetical protein
VGGFEPVRCKIQHTWSSIFPTFSLIKAKIQYCWSSKLPDDFDTPPKGLPGIDVEASNGFWQSEAAQIYAMATSEQTPIANAQSSSAWSQISYCNSVGTFWVLTRVHLVVTGLVTVLGWSSGKPLGATQIEVGPHCEELPTNDGKRVLIAFG